MQWIKIHRKLLEWEWSDDPVMFSTWLHLLLMANYEDKKWHGEIVPRGSFVTSRSKLAEEIGISEKQVRTCIARLRDTGEIELKVTNKYSQITICKYDTYQLNETDEGQQRASEGPTKGQQRATTKEDKSIEIKERVSKDTPKKSGGAARKPDSLQEVIDYCNERNSFIDPEEFWDKNNAIGWVDKNGNAYKDWKAVLRNWERYRRQTARPSKTNDYKEEEIWQ